MMTTTSVSRSNGSSEDGSHSTQTKSKQEYDMEDELASHTWQFSPVEVARMLSPKTPIGGIEVAGGLLSLDQYDCVADGPIFQDTLNNVVTRLRNDNKPIPHSLDHHDLVAFLTECVAACHDALDERQVTPLRQDRWFKGLGFTVNDILVTSLGESVPFRSDIADGLGLSPPGDGALHWGPLDGESSHRVVLVVETGGSWKETVSQAAGSARRSFGGSQVRSFVPVLAFNRVSQALRFLIFHHGGVTASEPCSITEPGGSKEAMRMFLALAFWSTPVGTGFTPSFTDTEYALPADCLGKTYMVAVVNEVLSRSPRVCGRMTLVSRLHLLRNSPADGGPFQRHVLTAC